MSRRDPRHPSGCEGRVRRPLHRRLFVWFGASIALTAVAAASALKLPWVAHPQSGAPRPLLILVVLAAVLWAASHAIARRIARPLADLARVAGRIGRGELSARARLGCRQADEVGAVAEAINDMAGRLEGQLRDQRVLLAAVSHELRTPLGHVRLLLELARSAPDEAERERALAEIEAEVMEVDNLVGELLASARLDFASAQLRPLDAAELGRRALERAGLSPALLELEGELGGLFGDPTLLARALANLLENAAEHGQGVSRLRIEGHEGRVAFVVEDEGPGLPAGEEARIFEPFYRRPGPLGGGSVGLGLALVKRIADAHGGRTFAQDRPGKGARIGLVVPRHEVSEAPPPLLAARSEPPRGELPELRA